MSKEWTSKPATVPVGLGFDQQGSDDGQMGWGGGLVSGSRETLTVNGCGSKMAGTG